MNMDLFTQSDSVQVNHFSKPNMMFYEDRLRTFQDWSKQITPDRVSLSKAGFYYTGSADKVTCFACSANVMSWESTDDPWVEHEKWSPTCIYLKMTGYKSENKNLVQPVGGFRFETASKNNQTASGFTPTFGQNSGNSPNFGFGSNSSTGANLFVRR